MSSTNDWSTTILSILFGVFFLFGIYLWFEAREEDGDGNKVFSPQKLGIILRNIFGYCCPDVVLIFFSNLCICCGYVGNSCLDQIQADEEIRETKRLARLAASLSKKSKQKKKKQKSRKVDHDFEALSSSEDERDLEAGSNDSAGSSGSGRREKIRSSNQKSPIEYPTHSVRVPSSHGLDHGDRAERGMVSSTFEETNLFQQQTQPQMESEIQEDEESTIASTYSDPRSSDTESNSSEEQITESKTHKTILNPSSSSSSHTKNSQKNSILANHFIAKEYLERHIAIEDQLLAQQTSFSLLSLSSLAPPPPRTKPLSSVY